MKRLIFSVLLVLMVVVLCSCNASEKSDNQTSESLTATDENYSENQSTTENQSTSNDGASDTTSLKNQDITDKTTTHKKSEYINSVDIYSGSKVTMNALPTSYLQFHNEQSAIDYIKENAVKIVNSSMTQFQAVVAINDFIVSNFSYNETNTFNEFISTKKGACADYAFLFQCLCKQVGIKA
ncbi:MAG: transglutaminase-like domain-containing protein, partial [Clostridiales bacterium]|nr:transglutaminase-like domain-containing protein [Clostridiales bacterium]